MAVSFDADTRCRQLAGALATLTPLLHVAESMHLVELQNLLLGTFRPDFSICGRLNSPAFETSMAGGRICLGSKDQKKVLLEFLL